MELINNYRRGGYAQWTYLIILDACRYDVFEEVVVERGLRGKLERVNTGVTNTAFWYRKYWSHYSTDVNLISANPTPFSEDAWYAYRRFKTAIWADPEGKYCRTREELMERIYPLMNTTGFGIFHPRIALDIFAECKQVGERYLIHLIPPHLPFLGPKGKRLFRELGLELHMHRNIYDALTEYGDWDYLRECYKESLEVALDYLFSRKGLFADGKTVITSDHAELIGEGGLYRHARTLGRQDLFEILATVPWFEVMW